MSSEASPQTDKWTPQLAGGNAASHDVQEYYFICKEFGVSRSLVLVAQF